MIIRADFPVRGSRTHVLNHLTQHERPGWSTGALRARAHFEPPDTAPEDRRPPGRPPGAPTEVSVSAWLLRKGPPDRAGAWCVLSPKGDALISELIWCLDVLDRSGYRIRYRTERMTGAPWPVKYRGRILHVLEIWPDREGAEASEWAMGGRLEFLRACKRT